MLTTLMLSAAMPMPAMPNGMDNAGFRKMAEYGSGIEVRDSRGKGPMMGAPFATGSGIAGKMEEKMFAILTEGLSESDSAKVKSILDAHKESMASFSEKAKAVASMTGEEKKSAMEALKKEMEASMEALKKELSTILPEDRLSAFDREHSMKMGGRFERKEGSGSTMGDGNMGRHMGMSRGEKNVQERQYGPADKKLYDKVGTLLDAKVSKMSETEAESYLTRIVSKIEELVSGQNVKASVRKKLVVIKDAVESKLAEISVDLGSILE